MQVSNNEILKNQIEAGTLGRLCGHQFEDYIADLINSISLPFLPVDIGNETIFTGNPALTLLSKIIEDKKIAPSSIVKIEAFPTGKLATSEKKIDGITIDGAKVKKSKSDVIIKVMTSNESLITGVSIKQCNKKTPTNDQIFFTTASAFFELLHKHWPSLTENAKIALKQFCGDKGYRPIDCEDCSNRVVSPERYFWEEIDSRGKEELERLITAHQSEITRILLQEAYSDDPFKPEFVLHKTRLIPNTCEVAIYSIPQLVHLSDEYKGYEPHYYRVKKGRFKEPQNILHEAPQFGIMQFQRGGQTQHPTQLQFNLEAGYYYKIQDLPKTNSDISLFSLI